MVHRFGAEFRRADESYVSALSLMAPVFELPLSDVMVTDGEKAVLECRVAATPAAEVTWYVDNVEIRQTDDYQIIYTRDGWCRLIIRDVMLEDEGEYTVKAVNEAGTCISTAYLTVLRKFLSTETLFLDQKLIPYRYSSCLCSSFCSSSSSWGRPLHRSPRLRRFKSA